MDQLNETVPVLISAMQSGISLSRLRNQDCRHTGLKSALGSRGMSILRRNRPFASPSSAPSAPFLRQMRRRSRAWLASLSAGSRVPGGSQQKWLGECSTTYGGAAPEAERSVLAGYYSLIVCLFAAMASTALRQENVRTIVYKKVLLCARHQ